MKKKKLKRSGGKKEEGEKNKMKERMNKNRQWSRKIGRETEGKEKSI